MVNTQCAFFFYGIEFHVDAQATKVQLANSVSRLSGT
ncbi:hypothetical protein D037_3550A, partial [Vibrio parahaemolyticus IDH02640]